MKTKHLLGALLSFLYTIIFFSCGNNDEKKIYSLSFEKEYYERPLLGTTNITITGGNRDYTVTVEKTDILNIEEAEKRLKLPKFKKANIALVILEP